MLIDFFPAFTSFADCAARKSRFVVPDSTETDMPGEARERGQVLGVPGLDHDRLADLEVVDEVDLLAAVGRVVHAADDGVALLRLAARR